MRFAAWAVLLATLLLWSGNWIVARAVRDDIAPGVATLSRLVIVLALLLPFTARSLAGKFRRLGASDWKNLAALGFAGGGLHLALQWLGLHYTTATSAVLFLSTSPIFILLLAPLLGEHIRSRQWAGVVLSFCGVAAIAAQGDLARLGSLRFNRGDLMALASMAMWATYTVLLRARRDPLTTVELIVAVCAFGALFVAPWVAVEIALGSALTLTRWGVAAVLYSAIGSLLLAYAGWSYVVARLGAARAGATMHLMPAFGIGLAALFLGEYPQVYHLVGIGLILGGVALSSVK